jgi:hypothetical protein
MRLSFTFVSIACAIGYGFSVPAANERPVAGESASEKSSPAPDEKSEETVPRELLAWEEYDAAIKDMQKAIQLQRHERTYQFDMERIRALLTSKAQDTRSTNPH